MSGAHSHGADDRIQSVSVRIALDDTSTTCTDCGGTIAPGERHKVAAVRDDQRVVHREFCAQDCLDSWTGTSPAAD